MENSSIAEIFKKAIIFEKQGHAFYEKTAELSEIPEIANIFRIMAKEETVHEKYLSDKLKSLSDELSYDSGLSAGKAYEFSGAMLTEKIATEIRGASYEAAAISAAMSLEIRSVQFYNSSAESAGSESEKKLFRDLADWENSHFKILSDINRLILERALQEDIY